MKITYHLRQLSQREQEYLEMVLLGEIDLQSWYAVTYSNIVGEELIIMLH